jgi:hypothetical protein
MKHKIVVDTKLINVALNAYLKSKGHTNIITYESTEGGLVVETEHVARKSFGVSVPATCEWPHDCLIQCGDSGVVFVEGGDNYQTAFWEAFPETPSTFIRGEGATIQEAEQNCFAQYQRILACPEHEFERGRYESGAGICKHCKLFLSGVFEPTEVFKKREEERRAHVQRLEKDLLSTLAETTPEA